MGKTINGRQDGGVGRTSSSTKGFNCIFRLINITAAIVGGGRAAVTVTTGIIP
ncbi:hypothetical protein Hdeb2414_s0005g00175001 [Helianthus debilis subsp. tardiflorus]